MTKLIRSVRRGSSWLTTKRETEAIKILHDQIQNEGGSVVINTLYHNKALARMFPYDHWRRAMVKYCIMRWLWLGKVKTRCDNGIKTIKWVGD